MLAPVTVAEANAAVPVAVPLDAVAAAAAVAQASSPTVWAVYVMELNARAVEQTPFVSWTISYFNTDQHTFPGISAIDQIAADKMDGNSRSNSVVVQSLLHRQLMAEFWSAAAPVVHWQK